MLDEIKTIADILAGLMTFAAGSAAAAWFLYTTQFKPRLQFDLDCRCFSQNGASGTRLLELQCILENKGFVEHRLYDLAIAVHGASAETVAAAAEVTETPQNEFPVRLLPRTMIVPPVYRYYFVRPGVKQVITYSLRITDNVSLLRVTAGFCYSKNSKFPHTARRIFEISPIAHKG